ncbi:cyclodeaminase/cyclohydrolase family protein [Actinokineospora spheciospongiae]|uniref:cyclodeaminase/cyclohydrolase family protein n=1 Tax=Actinokineospora spheciospongiae TaxID=909613 RepID=UPI000D71CA62|nr:cyclodeaminase/cyclohydrolase family protein [Actinokineospora spheciospongiae]PWW62318.1 formiminotetrahydrofolate cyclodeaminase [Actinokineospora spheciospongiae]
MKDSTIGSWLAELGDRTPTPGGGGAAALLAATGASLVGMVSSYTTGGKWADRDADMLAVKAESDLLREQALALAAADAEAFAAVGAAYGLPRATDEDKAARRTAIQAALRGAAEPPAEVGRVATRIVELADGLVERGNPNVVSDVAVAASSAAAALESAIVNIEINVASIKDAEVADGLRATVTELTGAIERARGIVERVREGLRG